VNARSRKALEIGLEVAVPIAILGIWQLLTADHTKIQDHFPRLTAVFVLFRKMWLFSQFGSEVVPSLERIAMGFGIAVAVALLLGVPLGLSRWLRLAALPHLEYWRNMVPPALLPISVVLLHSIGNTQKVAFIAFFCLWPVLLNTVDGVRGIDPTLIDTARSYAVPRRTRILRLVLPAASPQIVAGMRNSLALAVIMMVLSEYFSSTNGVGFVLLNAKNTFQMKTMWSAILLIGLLGFLLNALFLLAERRVLAWHRGWRASAT
jgi:ABC-type nitrate/sulfonate/bicarbonate transport system permease component